MNMPFAQLATLMQGVSVLLLVIFFVALAQASRSRVLWLWAAAWFADLLAVVVATVLWGRAAVIPHTLYSVGYVLFKSIFVMLLVFGVVELLRGRVRHGLRTTLVVAVASSFVAGALAVGGAALASSVEGVVITLGLGGCAAWLWRHPVPRSGWLAAGLAARALLAVFELVGTVWPAALIGAPIRVLLSVSSSLDAAVEWAIALATLLVLHTLTEEKLRRANVDLVEAQRDLQMRINHDELTGVLNRRALPRLLADASTTGASVVFFDIDHFKLVNDRYGHAVGDACLKRFAAALQRGFRSGDHTVRYAGDEFLVVAPTLPAAALQPRIDAMRGELGTREGDVPAIEFSSGVVDLTPGNDPETALRQADAAMYANKALRRHAQGPGVALPQR